MNTTPFEHTLTHDTELTLAAEYGASVLVVLVDAQGNEFPARAFFEAAGASVTPGAAHAAVASTVPMLHIPEHTVQHALGRPLSRRDAVIVRDVRYRFERPLPDGYGMVDCKLLKEENHV